MCIRNFLKKNMNIFTNLNLLNRTTYKLFFKISLFVFQRSHMGSKKISKCFFFLGKLSLENAFTKNIKSEKITKSTYCFPQTHLSLSNRRSTVLWGILYYTSGPWTLSVLQTSRLCTFHFSGPSHHFYHIYTDSSERTLSKRLKHIGNCRMTGTQLNGMQCLTWKRWPGVIAWMLLLACLLLFCFLYRIHKAAC